MALQSLGGGLLLWPQPILGTGSQAQTIDADGEYIALCCLNPTARAARGLAASITSLVAAGGLRFRIETVNPTTWVPTGTLAVAGASVDVTVSATGLAKADFGADVFMPAGPVALVAKRVSGTFDGTLRLCLNSSWNRFPPWGITAAGAVNTNIPNGVAVFSGVPPDETYLRMPDVFPPDSGAVNVNVVSNGEAGCLVNVPFRCRAHGFMFNGRQTGTPSQPAEARLYASDGSTQLASGTFDIYLGSNVLAYYIPFSAPVTLSAGDYFMIVHGFDSTNYALFSVLTLDDSALSAVAGVGPFLTRTGSSGAFTENNQMGMMALVLDQLEDGVGTTPARADVHLGVI